LIKRNAHQAIQLVHRIINLHQGKTGESNYHNLNEISSDLAELVRKIVPRRVEFSLELCPEALPVYVDAEELRQVVINLVLNAIDAMPISCPARLLVRTAHHATLPNLPNLQGVAPRTPAASLSVQDSGTGIKARHQTSIFDPFFTTKHSNKGSGLGLYNARLFVERHRGGISVDTQEGVGTTFHLWLPQTDFSEIEHGKSCRSNASGRGLLIMSNEMPDSALHPILVVDDEEVVLVSLRDLLRREGYQVTTAPNAVEALGPPQGASLLRGHHRSPDAYAHRT
jgi:two-component system cell cycle sensor histidine kinase/response regulator CckA